MRRVFGALFILVGVGLTIAGGLGIAGFGTAGTLQVKSPLLQTSPDSSAIVVDVTAVDAGFPWSEDLGDVTIGAEGQSGQSLFVGYGLRTDVNDYLAGVGFDAVAQRSGEWETRVIPGIDEPAPPADQDFWLGQAVGTDASVDFTSPSSGDVSVVVMNQDGTARVAAELLVGYESDVVFPASLGAVILGAGLVLLGIFLVIRRSKRERAQSVDSTYQTLAPDQKTSTQATDTRSAAESAQEATSNADSNGDSIPSDWLRPGSEK
ncbi:MAG: hypothetical protein K0U60_01870 [Actinomycetia bacterium]|nr:hypothetical protein [Actinomycetes bacterium]MCH9800717.1 hypothetical protein [Actinomycetes bacterium]